MGESKGSISNWLKKPLFLNEMKVPNRFAAQAMEINSSSAGGSVSERIIKRYSQLAKGQWGLVFSEAVSVTDEYMARKNGLIINKKNLSGIKQLVETYKNLFPGGLFLFQLTHSGRCSGDFSKKIKAYEDKYSDIPAASKEDIERIKDQFMEAIDLSHEAGADGFDIKACHGYWGCELLRPCNVRNDEYGVSIGNRARFLSSIIKYAVKKYPLMIVGTRLSLYEGIRGGCGTSGPDEVIEELEDIKHIIKILVNSGAHFINVSAGVPMMTPGLTRPDKSSLSNIFHHFRYAKAVKSEFPGIAVIGSAYSSACDDSVNYAEENISKGYVDLVGYGRQNLADPLFPKKVMEDKNDYNICTLCSGCSRLLKKQDEVRCVVYNSEE